MKSLEELKVIREKMQGLVSFRSEGAENFPILDGYKSTYQFVAVQDVLLQAVLKSSKHQKKKSQNMVQKKKLRSLKQDVSVFVHQVQS